MKLHVLMIIELGPPVVFLAKRPSGEDRGETAVSQAKEEFDPGEVTPL